MKVAYLHGLDSEPTKEKVKVLSDIADVYAPFLDYRNDKDIFNTVLSYLKSNPVDLIIGSSMGGWLAYCISTNLETKTLLFNPAVYSRSIETNFKIGNIKSQHTVVLGYNDTVVNPDLSTEWFKSNKIYFGGVNTLYKEDIGHRIPLDIFSKYFYNTLNESKKTFILEDERYGC